MTGKKGEYNPFQGDIAAFLDGVTKIHNEQQIKKEGGADVAVAPSQPVESSSAKKGAKSNGLNMTSTEAFPMLGEGIPVVAPTWGSGPLQPVASQHIQPSVISQTFELAAEQQKPLRSEGRDKTKRTISQVCQEIARATRTTIDASTSNRTRAITFVIRGKAVDVADAKRKLWAEVAQSMTGSQEVPEEFLGGLIGAGGKNIQALMAATGTKISTAKKDDNSYDGHVLISGDLDGINEVKRRIQAMIDEKTRKASVKIELKAHLLPFVFGIPSGQVVDQLQAWSTRYSVRMSQEAFDRNTDSATILISGDRDEVRIAHDEFTRLLDEQQRSVKSVSTSVPKALHRFLIGPKGSVLQEIESETGCLLAIPPVESSSDQVSIYGPQEKLFKGLSAVMERSGTMASETVRMPAGLRTVLFERFSAKLAELQSGNEASLHSVPEGVQVNGYKNKVPVVLAALQDLVKQLSGWTFDSGLQVDPKYFKHIIGKRGLKLKEIETECGAYVLVPHEPKKEGEAVPLLIAGPTKASVEAAKEHLGDLVSSLVDFAFVKIPVDRKYHRLLAGRGHTNLAKYTQDTPSVAIFMEADEVIVKGRKDEVKAVQYAIQADVNAIKHDAIMHGYTIGIDLTPDQTRHVHYTGGNNNIGGKRMTHEHWLMDLARDYDVQVRLEADGRKLEISGLKKLVEEARQAIQEEISRRDNIGSISVDLDHNMHGRLIGKGFKNVKHLERKYGVTLSFPDAGAASDRITISGPKASLAAAKAELVSFYEYLAERQHKVELSLAAEVVPRVIGKGHETIEAIREETDTTVDFSEDPAGEGHRLAIIQGTEKGVKEAKARIEAIVSAWEQEASETIQLTPGQYASLSDAAAFAFRRLADAHGPDVHARLYKGREGEQPHIHVFGPKAKVPALLPPLGDLVKQCESYAWVSVPIPVAAHPEIIGSGGENIRKLSSELSVRIDVPRGGKSEEVRVTGLPDHLAKAVSVLQSYVREERLFPAATRSLRDTLMASLAESHPNVRVIPKPQGLFLRGQASDLNSALAALSLAAAEQHSETIDVPKAQHGLLIGPRGSTAKAIRESSGGASVDVPPRDDASTLVTISGSDAAIAKAKAEIERILSDHQH